MKRLGSRGSAAITAERLIVPSPCYATDFAAYTACAKHRLLVHRLDGHASILRLTSTETARAAWQGVECQKTTDHMQQAESDWLRWVG